MPLSHAVTLPFGALGLALAVYCGRRLIGFLKNSVVGRWPVVERQNLELSESGRFLLNIECPQLSFSDFGMGALTLSASVTDASTGREIPVRKVLFGAEVKGFSKRRRPLFSFEPEHAGSYHLVVNGIPDRKGLEKCNFLLCRPLGIRVVALIVGIVVGFVSLALSVVLPLAKS